MGDRKKKLIDVFYAPYIYMPCTYSKCMLFITLRPFDFVNYPPNPVLERY